MIDRLVCREHSPVRTGLTRSFGARGREAAVGYGDDVAVRVEVHPEPGVAQPLTAEPLLEEDVLAEPTR
ncbi:hypothetical protein C1280_26680 [Gemmata obscuriglobus]|uniref:Uncharacterized protein n=1 Tax=Gemmata obscuriglobus TaxID=114 RepID=A0A2Z3HER0_9BACT|nr:hypothetical protein C1280_26680 [Gemmata obscuriglobus]